MSLQKIENCPGTLANGFNTYSRACLNKLFNSKKVSHILPYDSPNSNSDNDVLFDESRKNISISGFQEKFSIILQKNKLRLIKEGERGTHILKPIPSLGKKKDQMPANEHLTMQIANQVYGINTAANAIIFFKDGATAYITKRFDIDKEGNKLAQEDFASIAGRVPQIHGEHYKYLGNYLELFYILKASVPAYKIEAPKLLKLIMFNYLFSNGDAHYKNFSFIETSFGDYKLSPAYDLLNSRIHVNDSDFALKDGLLPPNMAHGKISKQFAIIANLAEINENVYKRIISLMLSKSNKVKALIDSSYLNETTKRNYWQMYKRKVKVLAKDV